MIYVLKTTFKHQTANKRIKNETKLMRKGGIQINAKLSLPVATTNAQTNIKLPNDRPNCLLTKCKAYQDLQAQVLSYSLGLWGLCETTKGSSILAQHELTQLVKSLSYAKINCDHVFRKFANTLRKNVEDTCFYLCAKKRFLNVVPKFTEDFPAKFVCNNFCDFLKTIFPVSFRCLPLEFFKVPCSVLEFVSLYGVSISGSLYCNIHTAILVISLVNLT